MLSIKKIFLGFGILFMSQSVLSADYRVEITNLTYFIDFTPRIVIAHVPVSFFSPGDNLNDSTGGLLNGQVNGALTDIAESGNIEPMMSILNQESISPSVTYATGEGFLDRGQREIVDLVSVEEGQTQISLFAMMLPTNDGFIALNNKDLPETGSVSYMIPGYDAGTETNTESCAQIPGLFCGGVGPSPDNTGEGFVHIHRGIRGINDINAARYDWRNPVALVTITKISP